MYVFCFVLFFFSLFNSLSLIHDSNSANLIETNYESDAFLHEQIESLCQSNWCHSWVNIRWTSLSFCIRHVYTLASASTSLCAHSTRNDWSFVVLEIGFSFFRQKQMWNPIHCQQQQAFGLNCNFPRIHQLFFNYFSMLFCSWLIKFQLKTTRKRRHTYTLFLSHKVCVHLRLVNSCGVRACARARRGLQMIFHKPKTRITDKTWLHFANHLQYYNDRQWTGLRWMPVSGFGFTIIITWFAFNGAKLHLLMSSPLLQWCGGTRDSSNRHQFPFLCTVAHWWH